ncbi:PREDICTED: uncharacterized protein LOC105951465 [Erythranthe guttata]|uniref:uncharacterized protein LOC105951465 n=1 Tax=Erythranthe guttata TaxID=4155 RepID=UPI00064D7D48|nr:PREDICTED: uncharacterized protein LOC105951465 [Erythranthe guttata]|eukprot:XP_012830367.1 PREDICTED: uncharacterized protein LOC105951465 [Erythranthe guttata]
MEQNWDAQKMLDLYIYNHLIRRNRHTTAEIFTREANFHPTPVALDPPEGFLSEWWSIFWSVYSARYPEETGDSSSKSNGNGPQHVQPAVLQNPNLNHMQQNTYPTMQRQALPNMLQNAGPTIIPRPNNIGNILQGSNLSTMTPFPGLKLAPFSGFNMTSGQSINRFAVRDLNSNSNFNSQLLNIDQLAGMMPSSSNSSLPQDRVYKNPQLCLTRDNKFGTSLWRSTIPDPTRILPKPVDLKLKHADTGSRMNEQVNLNFNSHNVGVDQLSRFLPFSAICSHSREEIEKKPMQFSLTRDERCGTSASPAHHPPTNIQLKMGPSDTDARMRENAHFGIPLNFNSNIVDVNQLATLMNSSSNFSNYQKNKKRQLSISGGVCLKFIQLIGFRFIEKRIISDFFLKNLLYRMTNAVLVRRNRVLQSQLIMQQKLPSLKPNLLKQEYLSKGILVFLPGTSIPSHSFLVLMNYLACCHVQPIAGILRTKNVVLVRRNLMLQRQLVRHRKLKNLEKNVLIQVSYILYNIAFFSLVMMIYICILLMSLVLGSSASYKATSSGSSS